MIASDFSKVRLNPFRKTGAVLQSQLNQGLSPHELALACALGATIGVMPLVWGTSLICFALAAVFRLNQLAVQTANYLVYPLQFLLFLPYLMGAEILLSTDHLPADLSQLKHLVTQTPETFLYNFWQVNLLGLCLWFFSTPLLLGSIYLITRPCFKRLKSVNQTPRNV